MGQDKALTRYLDSARIRNFTPKTIQRKRNEIARFRWWLLDEGRVSSLASVSDETARDYRRHLANQPIGKMTWAPQLHTVKHFFAWAHRENLVLPDQFEMIWLDGTKSYIFRGVEGTFVQMWPLGPQRATLTVDGPTPRTTSPPFRTRTTSPRTPRTSTIR